MACMMSKMFHLSNWDTIMVLMLTTTMLSRAYHHAHRGSTGSIRRLSSRRHDYCNRFHMTATDTVSLSPAAPVVTTPLSHLSNARVLTCGDGDLSFTAALSQLNICKSIVASTWDSSERLLKSFEKAASNIDTIQCSRHGSVRYHVDATKLCESFGSTVDEGQFDTILWNFPHVAGKQNIKRNRELVQNFLKSARELFTITGIGADGVVKVSLCGGQSGTNAGTMDDWNFSWQLLHQAAEAGFHLVQVEAFDEAVMRASFPGYGVQGHRGHGGNFPIGLGSEMFTFRLPHPDAAVTTDSTGSGAEQGLQVERTVGSQGARSLQAPMYIHEVHLLADQLCTDLNVLEGRARRAVVDIIARHEAAEAGDGEASGSTRSSDVGISSGTKHSSVDSTGEGHSTSTTTSSVWAVHLVDVYTCPRTHQVSHTFQVAYACTSLSAQAVGRSRADEYRSVVERLLPEALGMVPRTVKHGGKVSMPYPWYVTAAVREMAARPSQLWRQGEESGRDVCLADVSSALRSMEGDRDGGGGLRNLSEDDGIRSGGDGNSGNDSGRDDSGIVTSGNSVDSSGSGGTRRTVEEEHIRAIARTLWRRRVGVLIHTAAVNQDALE